VSGGGSAGDCDTGLKIAIVGMAGRFPGADSVQALWELLKSGREARTQFTREELEKKGVAPELLDNPAYVKAGMPLEGRERFDAAFFRYSQRQAESIDPQQRLFLPPTRGSACSAARVSMATCGWRSPRTSAPCR
jgi:acyl transferase domain-containing protein